MPLRFILWGAALVIDIGGVWHRSTRRLYAPLPVSRSHLPERFGLFTIIVLGESVLGVVGGLVLSAGALESVLVAMIGLVIAFSIWWIYFEGVSGTVFRQIGSIRPVVWLYSHLPLMIAITALGVGVELAILHDPAMPLGPEGWLLAGGVTATLLAIGFIVLAQEGLVGPRTALRVPQIVFPAAVGALLGFLPGLLLVGLLAAATVTQAALDSLTKKRFDRPSSQGVS